MLQSFDVMSHPTEARPRLALLRARLSKDGVDAFIIPRADEHQGEYVPARAERLKWLTGFTGSAGAALVLRDSAVLFVDGRYRLQAHHQVDPEMFEIEDLVARPPAKWLGHKAGSGMRVGFDPWLHTLKEVDSLARALARNGAQLVPMEPNPVDAVWEDQPPPPRGQAKVHAPRFAGEEASAKLTRLAEAVSAAGAGHCVLSDPSSLAWAFNIRGSDIAHTPLALGFAILSASGRHVVFINRAKLSGATEAHLAALAEIEPPEKLVEHLASLAEGGAKVALDPELAPEKLRMAVRAAGGEIVETPDPARLPRAIKNATELEGARAAHRRDAIAMVRFLAWLDAQPPGTTDEIGAAMRLEELRSATGHAFQMPLRDIAFDTISGAGPHGAIVHYRVTTATNRRLGEGELYLVDSGGQYQDGTTDITRTIAIGQPSTAMRQHYTLVLKGLIAISLLRFPPGTRGQDIDAVARLALWRSGLDYAHGTGHGVGSFLSVHEGPQRIARTGAATLMAGMILSNEPGYYREGEYGIRVENLIVVREPMPIKGGDIEMHGFETLTLVPFDRRLIDAELLSGEERDFLDAYHARVMAEVGPHMDAETRAWLERATVPLAVQPKK